MPALSRPGAAPGHWPVALHGRPQESARTVASPAGSSVADLGWQVPGAGPQRALALGLRDPQFQGGRPQEAPTQGLEAARGQASAGLPWGWLQSLQWPPGSPQRPTLVLLTLVSPASRCGRPCSQAGLGWWPGGHPTLTSCPAGSLAPGEGLPGRGPGGRGRQALQGARLPALGTSAKGTSRAQSLDPPPSSAFSSRGRPPRPALGHPSSGSAPPGSGVLMPCPSPRPLLFAPTRWRDHRVGALPLPGPFSWPPSSCGALVAFWSVESKAGELCP